jgi:diguanylate cyclase (GGDEF)-like protein
MVTAVELMQDVQLACFAVIFAFMAMGNRSDRVLRLIWYSFLVDGVAGIIALLAPHLPHWIGYGVNYESASLSYGIMSFAFALFIDRELWTRWITVALVVGSLPFYLYWCNSASHVKPIGVIDFALFVQTSVTAWLLTRSCERSTLSPRLTMSVFLAVYAGVELYRACVVALLHTDPDGIYPVMQEITSAVYVISASVLPLAVIWMMNARMQSALLVQSVIDPLTEVLNRRGMEDASRTEMARYARGGQNFAVAVADIDRFKQLNDTRGHACGDEVLRAVAAVFRGALRQSDVVSRSGGEEFVLLLPMTSEEESIAVVERLRAALEAHVVPFGGTDVKVTVSIGIAGTAGRSDLTWSQLQHEADVALYSAKRAGRNRCLHYREIAVGKATIAPTMTARAEDLDYGAFPT